MYEVNIAEHTQLVAPFSHAWIINFIVRVHSMNLYECNTYSQFEGRVGLWAETAKWIRNIALMAFNKMVHMPLRDTWHWTPILRRRKKK